jgi:hypothetical protein
LALTSPTGGGCSVGIVCSRTKATEFSLELNEGGWSALRPGRFTRGGKETQYPLYRRLCGPQGQSGWVENASPPPVFDPRTVQPVTSRNTDRAIPAHELHR